jgi:hypothetical protein
MYASMLNYNVITPARYIVNRLKVLVYIAPATNLISKQV